MMDQSPTGAGRRALIVTGGRLGDWVLDEIETADYIIGADSGADFLVRRGIVPDLALGDFDSVAPERLPLIRETARSFQSVDAVDKDWTDTELALREAVGRGYAEVRIAGGLGTRFDHSLANVHLLRQARLTGSEACLVDEHNEIRLCAGRSALKSDDRFPYVSLLPLTTVVTGVTLTGFRYPLTDATLRLGWSIGVSNVLDAPLGTVTIAEGEVLIIRSRD